MPPIIKVIKKNKPASQSDIELVANAYANDPNPENKT